MTITRKYAMTRLGKGDYILPANDRATIWRISTYTEGPSSGLYDWPTDRTVWGAWKWTLSPERLADDFDDWGYWEFCYGMNRTRQEAIDSALGH